MFVLCKMLIALLLRAIYSTFRYTITFNHVMFSRCAIDDDLKLMQDYFIVSECGWNFLLPFLIEKRKLRFLLFFVHEYCDENAFP